ncbi:MULTISPECIES: hypothetical protein [unclassified Leifsonia]|uniref:hypothetical protein n=1 Tax=unclassified Leifsonia TaxID=2663824 RepID=UPI000A5355BA|nr:MULTISPECIES: hypothetical protein [unclassified Leifsonia]
MSQSPVPQPSRRDVLRPLEMVGGAAIAAVFLGLVVLMVTREPVLAAIGAGSVFIIVLVALAMFAITLKPDEAENADIAEQNSGAAGAGATPGPLSGAGGVGGADTISGTDDETPGTRGH